VERQLRVDEWHPYTSDWLEREQQVTCGFRSCEKMRRTRSSIDIASTHFNYAILTIDTIF
jgi:hypothetical protein